MECEGEIVRERERERALHCQFRWYLYGAREDAGDREGAGATNILLRVAIGRSDDAIYAYGCTRTST